MEKIVITRNIHDFVIKKLSKHYSIWKNPSTLPITRSELLKRVKDCSGLLCVPYDVIDAEVIDAAVNLRTISTYSVGYEHIDTKYAKRKKISIGYTPDVLSEATANMTLALLLDVTRRVSHGDRIIRAGKWRVPYEPQQMCGTDVSSKTLGIIGMGRIGTIVAKRAKAFGIKVVYHNRHRFAPSVEKKIGAKYKSITELLKTSHIVSLHVPYTADTHHLINKKTLSMMRKNSYLVNTSRGAIVDEKSLVDALKSAQIKGAGLDVFESEPINKKNPLCKFDNVTLVPHLGSATKETREDMARIAQDNMIAGLEGRKLPHSV